MSILYLVLPLALVIVLAAIAGFAVAAQTTASGAIQWPWKRDRGSEEIVLPPPTEGLPPGELILVPPANVTEVPLAPNDVIARLDRAEAKIRELTGQQYRNVYAGQADTLQAAPARVGTVLDRLDESMLVGAGSSTAA